MTNTKKTQKDFYNDIIALAESMDRVDIVEFCEGRLEVLDKKSKNKKATKTQEENEVYKATILSVLSADEGMTIAEIIKADNAFAEFSPQKMSALLTQLEKNEHKVVKTYEKKKAYFTLAE